MKIYTEVSRCFFFFLDRISSGISTDVMTAIGASMAILVVVILVLAYKWNKSRNKTIYGKSLQPNKDFEVFEMIHLKDISPI